MLFVIPGMKKARAVGLTILIVLLCGSTAGAQDAAGTREPEPSTPRALSPLAKSLLIPGWGQFAIGRPVEGGLFLGGLVLCLAGALDAGHRGSESYALYKAASTAADTVRWREATSRYDRRRNGFLLAGAAVWAFNLLDIWFLVKRGDGGLRSWTIHIGQDSHEGFVVGAGCRF
jgi:hypothetical protein